MLLAATWSNELIFILARSSGVCGLSFKTGIAISSAAASSRRVSADIFPSRNAKCTGVSASNASETDLRTCL